MKGWEKRFDSQQKMFYPFFLPFVKAIGMTPFLSKRQIMQLTEILDPFLRERNEKIIFYIRIYTSLVNASQFYDTGKKVKSRNIIAVVISRTLKTSFSEEKKHVEKLNSLSKELYSLINMDKVPTSGHNFKTKIQLAQNICVLRLLKI